jgi:SepF-like predicted cell division protein (DUF552 family)
MKKIFFLSLVLISTVARCMEEEAKKIELHEKNKLDTALRKAEHWLWLPADDPLRYLAIGRFPKNTYGYVEQDGEEYKNSLIKCSIQDLGNLYNAKEARYNGYSLIGAVTLSDITDHTKKTLIQNLRLAGFEATEKDEKLILDLSL